VIGNHRRLPPRLRIGPNGRDKHIDLAGCGARPAHGGDHVADVSRIARFDDTASEADGCARGVPGTISPAVAPWQAAWAVACRCRRCFTEGTQDRAWGGGEGVAGRKGFGDGS
jgi:hypothetical protein